MCGIVGYIGNERANEIILNGLKKLEYRGYDSAGISLVDSVVSHYKAVGKIKNLESVLDFSNTASLGIGHTRWATHGKPTETNCHPHICDSGQIILVHNGVIENYLELKKTYLSDVDFYSETDTEVIAKLLSKFFRETDSMIESMKKLIEVLEGSYALAIMVNGEKDTLYALKNKSPLLIGVGDDFKMLGSDSLALCEQTNRIMEIADLEIVKLTRENVEIFNQEGKLVDREVLEVASFDYEVNKGHFEHFMMKEIFDQPSVIRNLILEYLEDEDFINTKRKLFKEASSIHIIAAGTSYYSGLVSKSLLEKYLQKEVHVHVASEFVYDTPYISGNPLFVFVTQSGETADSRAALVKIKEMGYNSFTITNVDNSTLAREVDDYMLLHAGREIAVASTKAFVAQLTVFAILAIDDHQKLHRDLNDVIVAIEDIFERREQLEKLVKERMLNAKSCFYIGRALDYKLCLEGALKLKEISYIHTEGMSSGELKHGTIALIDEFSPVIALITQNSIASNTRANIQEVEARGAKVITIVKEDLANEHDNFTFKNVNDEFAGTVAVVALQLIAYYTALHLKRDIDMPRNLAKSVTVE